LVPAWQLVKLAKAHRALVGDALAELGLHVGQDLLLAELVPLVAEPAPSPSAELAHQQVIDLQLADVQPADAGTTDDQPAARPGNRVGGPRRLAVSPSRHGKPGGS
jgi:hypothetical protein